MKVGYIVEPNKKGQIVIPKDIRDELNITEKVPLNVVVRGTGIYLEPIDAVIPRGGKSKLYSDILKETAGAWANEDWEKEDELARKRRKLELAATRRRKKAW